LIYRTYACDDCGTEWEYHHDSGDEPVPDCPTCSKVLQWQPRGANIIGNKAKAIDYAQKVMEEDYGLTNFKDNNKEGDVGYIAPRKTAAELDSIGQRESEAGREVLNRMTQIAPELQQKADSFFGGQMATIGQNTVPVANLIAAGKSGPAADTNPMALLHEAGRQGKLPTMAQMTKVVAKADLK
jgi:DNA-directed RNA polymerase subunit RPC12/RpoP